MSDAKAQGFGFTGWLWRIALTVGLLISAVGWVHFASYSLPRGPLLTQGLLGMD